VRFFFRVDGVLANFTAHAAKYLDNLVLPLPEDGIFEESMIERHFVQEVLWDVCAGDAFWSGVPSYDWAWNYFAAAMRLSDSKVYFLGAANKVDADSWRGKANWIHARYGEYGLNHLMMSLDKRNLVLIASKSSDILVTAVKAEVEPWNRCGGSALLFPEIDPRSPRCAELVGARLNAMDEVVKLLSDTARCNS
jgi:hypothetical protein